MKGGRGGGKGGSGNGVECLTDTPGMLQVYKLPPFREHSAFRVVTVVE